MPAVVAQLTALIEAEVPVEVADTACKAYVKGLFRTLWYDLYGGAKGCVASMLWMYDGFDATDAAKVAKWLSSPCE